MTRGLPQEKGLPQASEGPPQAKNPTGDMAFFPFPRFLPFPHFSPFPTPLFPLFSCFSCAFPGVPKGNVFLLSRVLSRASGPAGRERILMPWSFWCLSSSFVLAATPPGKNSRGVNASSTHLGEAAAAALRLSTGEDSCLIRASVSCSTGWHRTVGRPDFLKGVL